jgi:hypothetical protein
MNPSDANRVQTFIDEVVLPTFSDLKTELETSEKLITIIRSTENIPEAVAAVVRQIHPETPYLASSPSSPSSSPQSWIVSSLYVEILQQLATESICIGQYCLSIEIQTTPSAQIQISSIVGYTQTTDKPLELQRSRFEKNHQRSDIEEIDDSGITLHFIESFDAFENNRLGLESTPAAPEQTSNLHIPSLLLSEPEREQLPIPATRPKCTPIPETPSQPQTPKPLSYEEAEAARGKIRAAQEQAIEPLLKYLKQSQKTFRSIWITDLARGAALAQKIIIDRPEPESDYQQAYDILTTQASEFAWSLKPNNLGEFADYFELYWTMAERASIFNASQENRPDPEAFITQVHALGEPENPGQAKPTITRALRSLVRSISVKFGYPSEPGKLNWIGSGKLQSFTSIEDTIQLIQDQNEKRKVLFETLSWGVLQVYQNVDDLPKKEHKLGYNLVLSYLISAKQTIRTPTQPVEIDENSIEYYEFRFKRKIEDNHRTWLATARVRVTRVYHRVNLYEYVIAEQRAPKRAEIE